MSKAEYFIVANSFAAPIVSDTSKDFVEGESAQDALDTFLAGYKHPCGLFSANVYPSADAYEKSREPLAKWRSPEAARGERHA